MAWPKFKDARVSDDRLVEPAQACQQVAAILPGGDMGGIGRDGLSIPISMLLWILSNWSCPRQVEQAAG